VHATYLPVNASRPPKASTSASEALCEDGAVGVLTATITGSHIDRSNDLLRPRQGGRDEEEMHDS
jgi:hypothetical protein